MATTREAGCAHNAQIQSNDLNQVEVSQLFPACYSIEMATDEKKMPLIVKLAAVQRKQRMLLPLGAMWRKRHAKILGN